MEGLVHGAGNFGLVLERKGLLCPTSRHISNPKPASTRPHLILVSEWRQAPWIFAWMCSEQKQGLKGHVDTPQRAEFLCTAPSPGLVSSGEMIPPPKSINILPFYCNSFNSTLLKCFWHTSITKFHATEFMESIMSLLGVAWLCFAGKKYWPFLLNFSKFPTRFLVWRLCPPPPNGTVQKIMLGAYRHEAHNPKLRSKAGTVHLQLLKLLALVWRKCRFALRKKGNRYSNG